MKVAGDSATTGSASPNVATTDQPAVEGWAKQVMDQEAGGLTGAIH
jgi:hypothetical protein